MPHKTVWEEKGIYWRFSGPVSSTEVEQANNEMYGNPRFDDIRYFIWDMADATAPEITVDVAEDAAATDRGASLTNAQIKGALISSNNYIDKLIQHYIKTSESMGTPWKLKLFNNLEDARSWVFCR